MIKYNIDVVMKFFIVSFFFLFLLTNVYAAPAPRYIAVNDDLNLCGEYWPGDELEQNEIPNGWRIVDENNFYPQVCTDLEYSNFNKECCELIGYQYVEDMNLYISEGEIGQENDNNEGVNTQDSKTFWIIGGAVALISIISLLFINKKVK